jgi:hypothetical protein
VKETPKVTGSVTDQALVEVPLQVIEKLRRGMEDGRVEPKPRLTFRRR